MAGMVTVILGGEAVRAGVVTRHELARWYAPLYRPTSAFITAAGTQATVQVGNAVPYLWNIQPAQ